MRTMLKKRPPHRAGSHTGFFNLGGLAVVLLSLAPGLVRGEGVPGLVLKLTSAAGQSDARVARTVALHVPDGAPVSPFLEQGGFTARWEGKLVLEKRSRLVFHLAGTGEGRLLVDGEELVPALGASMESMRLRSGEHEFVVEYTPPAKGDATLRLLWEGREFGREPMPGGLFVHDAEDPALKKQSLLRRGRELVAAKRCVACHEPGEDRMMPELLLAAPSLNGIGSRLEQDWLVKWISDPAAMRSSAHMPAVFRGEGAKEKAADIAAFLVADRLKLEGPHASAPDRVKEGGHLFYQQGCIACHTLDGKGDDERIALGTVGRKFRGKALEEFLRDPSRNHQGTRMPGFQFSAGEAQAVADFLRTQGERSQSTSIAGDPLRGHALARATGCFNCHEREGESGKAASKVGLFSLQSADCSSVHYNLSGEDKNALTVFLREEAGRGSLARHVPAEFAGRQFLGLRCNACHSRDGEEALLERFAGEAAHLKPPEESRNEEKPALVAGPPPLHHLGLKLRPGWREKLLAGRVSPKVRPWMPARMPAFPSRARALSVGFSHAEGLSATAEKPFVPDPAKVKIGEAMTAVEGGLACGTCHGIAEKGPIAVFEGEGPNLRDSGARLTREYFHLWMNDPPRVWPGTIMPKYALDGKTPLSQHYDGDAHKQFEAVYHYLRSLSQK